MAWWERRFRVSLHADDNGCHLLRGSRIFISSCITFSGAYINRLAAELQMTMFSLLRPNMADEIFLAIFSAQLSASCVSRTVENLYLFFRALEFMRRTGTEKIPEITYSLPIMLHDYVAV